MTNDQKAVSTKESKSEIEIPTLKCGIIMPIAAMGDYTESHWQDVKSIIIEATHQVDGLQFQTEIVSNSDGEINIIHKNIISNIYNSDIVVCDISARNPNVLFELGMRLTFDKPTIIIKDDETPYMFDTSSIETLQYPKDLRFARIVSFKKELASRIKSTYEKAKSDSSYSPFLGHFGEFVVPALNQTAVSDPQKIILNELSSLKEDIKSLKLTNQKIPKGRPISTYNSSDPFADETDLSLTIGSASMRKFIMDYLRVSGDKRKAEVIVRSKEFDFFLRKNGIDMAKLNFTTDDLIKMVIQAFETLVF